MTGAMFTISKTLIFRWRSPLIPGRPSVFQKDMEEIIKILKVEIPKVFESKEYENQKNKISRSLRKNREKSLPALKTKPRRKGFSVRKTVSGLIIMPVKKTGEPLTEEEYEALDEKTRKKIDEIGKDTAGKAE